MTVSIARLIDHSLLHPTLTDDELRSVNAQIEYLLREALRKAGRLPKPRHPTPEDNDT